jgi:N-methylhydantoinase A
VSDANLILGRLDPDRFLGGKIRLDCERTRFHLGRARASIGSVEEFAAGIVRLAESAMERAIRVISVERGYDPREFTLVAFGGAGPLHACALAKSLQIARVMVPEFPGALSALGILLADAVRDYSKTVMLDTMADLEPHFRELEAIGIAECETAQPVLTRSVDVRYTGQGYELNVPAGDTLLEDFHRAHRKRYGYADEAKPVVIVNVRIRVTTPAEPVEFVPSTIRPGDAGQAMVETRPAIFNGASRDTAVYDRNLLQAGDTFRGPAIVVEYSATTVVPPGCVVSVDACRNLVIEGT